MEKRLNDQEMIEHLFLWQTVQDSFEQHAQKVGIQYPPGEEYAMIVLAAHDLDNGFDAQLWATWRAGIGITQASFILKSIDCGREMFNYHLTSQRISQYSITPTSLDKEDLQDLRDDISTYEWSKEFSEHTAATYLFFD